MLRRITTIDDIKAELSRYFETMRALPMPKRPDYAKNYLWEMLKPEQTTEDIEETACKFNPLPVDIADCWYIDANWMPALFRFEFELLYARFREKPLPWKLLERKHRLSRQMLDIYIKRALNKLLDIAK